MAQVQAYLEGLTFGSQEALPETRAGFPIYAGSSHRLKEWQCKVNNRWRAVKTITHPELKATFQLQILGVKKNPNGPMYSSLGVMTKGTVIEVSVEELGLVTPGGKVVWGKYAQVTNNPENDGCVNAVLLV